MFVAEIAIGRAIDGGEVEVEVSGEGIQGIGGLY